MAKSWLDGLRLGEAAPRGDYAYVGHSSSLAFIRRSWGRNLTRFGLSDFDAATIRLSVPRRLTQEISRMVYETVTISGTRPAGIRYGSRLGDEFENWAVFETDPPSFRAVDARPISPGDPDLAEALG